MTLLVFKHLLLSIQDSLSTHTSLTHTHNHVPFSVVHLHDCDVIRAAHVLHLHDDAQVLHDPGVRAHLRAPDDRAPVARDAARVRRSQPRQFLREREEEGGDEARDAMMTIILTTLITGV